MCPEGETEVDGQHQAFNFKREEGLSDEEVQYGAVWLATQLVRLATHESANGEEL